MSIALRAWLAVCCACLALALPARAQNSGGPLDKWASPDPPAGGLMDSSGFFHRNPSVGERIAERLQRLHSEHGYRIYLVVEPALLTTDAPDLAARLRELWLAQGDGMVAVYEGDTRRLGIGRELGSRSDPLTKAKAVPTHETAVILNQAIAATDQSLSPEIYLETLVGHLADGFDRYFERRSAPPPRGRSIRLALLVIGVLAMLALCSIAVGALARLKSVQGIRTFHFKPVDCPERLGAPSGASVRSRAFRR
jgi:hypothetical protein